MAFNGKTFEKMREVLEKSYDKRDLLLGFMSYYNNMWEPVDLKEDKQLMYELCSHINEKIYKQRFVNPFNISIHILDLLIEIEETLGIDDLEDPLIEIPLNEFMINICNKEEDAWNKLKQAAFEIEEKDYKDLYKELESFINEEYGDKEDFLAYVQGETSEFLSSMYATYVIEDIDKMYKIAIDSFNDGIERSNIILSLLAIYSHIDSLMDAILSGLTNTENTYTTYVKDNLYNGDSFLTKHELEESLGYFNNICEDWDEGYLNEFINYLEDTVNYNEKYKPNTNRKDSYYLSKIKKYRDEIAESTSNYMSFLCDLSTGGWDSYTTSNKIYLDIFQQLKLK